MAVIDLKKFLGLALSYDGTRLVSQETGIDTGFERTVKITDMRPQLLNPDLSCPVVFYTIFSGIDRKSLMKRKNLLFELIVIPQNLAGIEYVKTKGFRIDMHPILVEIVYGYITLVMQSPTYDPVGDGLKTMVVKLKRGDKYVIPPHTDVVVVNSRQMTAVIAMIRSSKGEIDTVFDDTRGCAHYVIRKNARQEIVQNPNFRKVLRERPCKPEEVYRQFGLTAKTPIFKQILRKYDRFRWLHDPKKVDWFKVPRCE